MTQKYKYVVKDPEPSLPKYIQAVLDKMTKQGWEFMCATASTSEVGTYLYFRKKIS